MCEGAILIVTSFQLLTIMFVFTVNTSNRIIFRFRISRKNLLVYYSSNGTISKTAFTEALEMINWAGDLVIFNGTKAPHLFSYLNNCDINSVNLFC